MGLKVGDRLQLVSPVSIATPLGVMPRSAVGQVTAIFCAGMYDYDSNFVYAPMPDVQRLLELGNKVTTIEIFLKEGTPLAAARSAVTQAVGPQGWVFDWFQANFGFFAAIQGQTNVMFIVLTMIVLVAAFNIVSSLVMLVRTKTGDIAILRTMGATRGTILRLFLLDGLAIGGIGAAHRRRAGAGLRAEHRGDPAMAAAHVRPRAVRRDALPAGRDALAHRPGRRSRPSPAWPWSSRSPPRSIRRSRAARLDPVEGLRRE